MVGRSTFHKDDDERRESKLELEVHDSGSTKDVDESDPRFTMFATALLQMLVELAKEITERIATLWQSVTELT